MSSAKPISPFALKKAKGIPAPPPTGDTNQSTKLLHPQPHLSSSSDTLATSAPSQRVSLLDIPLFSSPFPTAPSSARESTLSESADSVSLAVRDSGTVYGDGGSHRASEPSETSREGEIKCEKGAEGFSGRLFELPEGWENQEFQDPAYALWRRAMLDALLGDHAFAEDDPEYPLVIAPDLAFLMSEEEF
ncbi:hypothetical protein BC830DRAFT_1151272 [Chytriomyces sp. MP71]|nr:hypothetical protein BC830DRAFT_1151272 [Chytriomyces sp. MP71]